MAWIFAAYFAVAWLLLLGVIIRPEHVTRTMLVVVTVIALVTQVPLAVTLETALHSSNMDLGQSIFTIGIPEELAKALPVLAVALIYRRRMDLIPGLPVPRRGQRAGLRRKRGRALLHRQRNRPVLSDGAVGYSPDRAADQYRALRLDLGIRRADRPGAVLQLDFVWRFVTDPVTHACWSGLTGYFIGLAATGRYKWYQVAWIGLAIAAILHGLNDWSRVNGHPAWILVVLVSGILFLGYAKVGSRGDLQVPEAWSAFGRARRRVRAKRWNGPPAGTPRTSAPDPGRAPRARRAARKQASQTLVGALTGTVRPRGCPRFPAKEEAAMAEETAFAMGAKASCTDGFLGEVNRMIIDPATETVTHLVIEPKHRRGAARLVPLNLVDTTVGEIRLRCTLAEFGSLDVAEETELVQEGYEGMAVAGIIPQWAFPIPC